MRKHKITQTCSHEEKYLIERNKAECAQKLSLLAGRSCDDCHWAARKERQEKAAAWAAKEGLPTLQGSSYDVPLAEVVRQETLTCNPLQQAVCMAAAILHGTNGIVLPTHLRRALANEATATAVREVAMYTEELIAALKAETSAVWWTTHRKGAAWAEVEQKIQRKTYTLKKVFRTVA